MTCRKLVVVLLTAFALVSVVESACPYQENIHPCACREESGITVLRCSNITDVSVLEKVAQNSDGYKYDEVHIERSTLQYIPKVVPETVRTKYLTLRYLTLNRLVDSTPNTLEELSTIVLESIKTQNGLSWEVFKNTPGLESLVVNQLTIPVIEEGFNKHVSHNLKTLYLQYTGTNKIDTGAFQDFQNLRTLSLMNNNLKSLQRDSFPMPFNLELLYLQNNKLSAIPDDFFRGMESLKAVFLAGNLISRLNESAFGSLRSKIVDVSDNPIKCDCFLKWIVNRNPRNIQGTCAAPKSLIGKSLTQLSNEDFNC